MFSENTGKDLIEEARQKDLKPFNSVQFLNLQNELYLINNKMEDIKKYVETHEISEGISVNFALLKSYKDHLLKIANCYKYTRFSKAQDYYILKEPYKNLLIQEELDMMSSFIEIYDRYLLKFRHLGLEDRNPPIDLFVQILTLEECGTILIGDGFLDLKKDKIYFLKKSDISHLIKKKLVKII